MPREDRVREVVDDRPDLESALAELYEVDGARESWSFDDVTVDSGAFGQLVSEGVVERDDGEYRLANPRAVRAVLDGESVSESPRTDNGGRVTLPQVEFDARVVGAIAGILVFFVLLRSFVFGSVFRGGTVVLGANDPYYYRYWVEGLFSPNGTLTGGGVPTGEPLFVITMGSIAAAFGGGSAVGTVLAVYPVVSAVVCGICVYLFAVRATDDRRVGLAALALLAVTPGHVLRTTLGFADHHAFDYIWLSVTAVALLVLVTENRPAEADPTTAIATLGLGVGVGGQLLSWDNAPLLLVPVAVVVVGYVTATVYAGQSPFAQTVPVIGGLIVGAVLSLGGHLLFGWHSFALAAVPVALCLGAVGVTAVGELFYRTGRSTTEFILAELAVGALSTVGAWLVIPGLTRRLSEGVGSVGRSDDIAEVQSLFSGDTLGFILLFGFTLVLAVPFLALFTRAAIEGRPEWTVACAYGWYFLLLTVFQARFAGQLSLFAAVFAGVGFVWLAEKVELTDAPKPLRDNSQATD